MFFYLFSFLLLVSESAIAQNMITGSTTWGTVILKPKGSTSIGDLTYNKKFNFKFITLDGKNNKVKVKLSGIIADMNLNDGSGKLTVGSDDWNLYISSSHHIGISGKIGKHSVDIQLSFTPGMKAITGSAAREVEDTDYKITVSAKGKRKIYEGSTRSSWW